jgi:hypothetical protein
MSGNDEQSNFKRVKFVNQKSLSHPKKKKKKKKSRLLFYSLPIKRRRKSAIGGRVCA